MGRLSGRYFRPEFKRKRNLPGEKHLLGQFQSTKKKTARTFYYPCREASDANYFQAGGEAHPAPHWNIYTIL
jgi:hypothetical protein